MKKGKEIKALVELQEQKKKIEKQFRQQGIKIGYPELKQAEGKFYRRICSGVKTYFQVKKVIKNSVYFVESENMFTVNIIALSFTITSNSLVIDKKQQDWLHNIGKPITKRQFIAAYRKAINQTNKIFK
jgi:hypothetical protein